MEFYFDLNVNNCTQLVATVLDVAALRCWTLDVAASAEDHPLGAAQRPGWVGRGETLAEPREGFRAMGVPSVKVSHCGSH